MDEKRSLANTSGRRGCALGAFVPVVSLLLLVLLVIGLFVALASGGFRLPLPALPDPGAAIAVAPLGGGFAAIGCIGAAIFFGALLLAAAILFCCCRKCAEPNLLELLRTIMEPISLALRVIQASLVAIAETVRALTALIAQVIETLKTVAEALRNLDLPDRPDAPPGVPTPTELVGLVVGVVQNLENGKTAGEQVANQLVDLAQSIPPPPPPPQPPEPKLPG